MNAPLDDPRYTAYALGELDAAARAAIEQEMAADPRLRARVEALRSFAGAIESELALEPVLTLDDARRETVWRAARGAGRTPGVRFPVWAMHAVVSAVAALILAVIGIWTLYPERGSDAGWEVDLGLDPDLQPVRAETAAAPDFGEPPPPPSRMLGDGSRKAFTAKALESIAEGAVPEIVPRAALPTGIPAAGMGASPDHRYSAETDRLVHESAGFAADLYRELAATSDGNLLFSPYGISSALSMTYAGARGHTAAEMAAALRLPLGQDALPPAFRALRRRILNAARDSGLELNIANGLCLTGGDVSAEFKEMLQAHYDAGIFAGDVDVINAWVSDQTEGRISKIIEGLSPDSVCVILNAMYFKGNWQDRFEVQQTREAPFHISRDRPTTASLMHQENRFKIIDREKFQALALPYHGGRLSMIVVLPRESGGLAVLEQAMTADALAEWRNALERQPLRQTRVYLPRFTLETDYNLVPVFRQLGMRAAWVPDVADFSGMGWPRGRFWLSQIVHKAFVNVDEEGTEAAAVTAVDAQAESRPPPPVVFRADRPFMFLIQDDATGVILFMGRIMDPTTEGQGISKNNGKGLR